MFLEYVNLATSTCFYCIFKISCVPVSQFLTQFLKSVRSAFESNGCENSLRHRYFRQFFSDVNISFIFPYLRGSNWMKIVYWLSVQLVSLNLKLAMTFSVSKSIDCSFKGPEDQENSLSYLQYRRTLWNNIYNSFINNGSSDWSALWYAPQSGDRAQ
jgi:hypothetical protein